MSQLLQSLFHQTPGFRQIPKLPKPRRIGVVCQRGGPDEVVTDQDFVSGRRPGRLSAFLFATPDIASEPGRNQNYGK